MDTARTTHQARSLAPGFRKQSHPARPCLSNGLAADFSLIYVKPYAGRALKIVYLIGRRGLARESDSAGLLLPQRPAYEPLWEAHMNSSLPPNDSSAYLESLMRAGQQSMKQFDDALVSAMGIEGKPPTGGDPSPFAFTANLQRQFWSPIVEF